MKTSPFSTQDSWRLATRFSPSLISRDAVDLKFAASVATESSYLDGAKLGKKNPPSSAVLAVNAGLPEGSISVIVASEIGLPAASRNTPRQEVAEGAPIIHPDTKRKATA